MVSNFPIRTQLKKTLYCDRKTISIKMQSTRTYKHGELNQSFYKRERKTWKWVDRSEKTKQNTQTLLVSTYLKNVKDL